MNIELIVKDGKIAAINPTNTDPVFVASVIIGQIVKLEGILGRSLQSEELEQAVQSSKALYCTELVRQDVPTETIQSDLSTLNVHLARLIDSLPPVPPAASARSVQSA